MKQGFTLLEVLIATAIASMLTTAIFFSYNQINKAVRSITNVTDLYETAILIEQQITKDITGAFIPVQAIPPDPSIGSQASPKATPGTAGQDEKKAKKVPVLKDPFISKNVGKNMSMFSYITANPMRVYWGKKTGEPKPSIARVVYSLEPDKDTDKKNPRYQLYRQEGIELELAPYTKRESAIERYMIADNISACKLTFIVADTPADAEAMADRQEGKKESDKKDNAPKKERPKDIEIKKFNDWIIGKEKKDVRTRMMIPDEVLMEITITDEFGRREETFKFPVRIAAGLQEPPIIKPQEKKKQEQNKKGAQQGQKKQPQSKQEILATGASSVVENLRAMFGT